MSYAKHCRECETFTRPCIACGEDRPYCDFLPYNMFPKRLGSRCKACRKEYASETGYARETRWHESFSLAVEAEDRTAHIPPPDRAHRDTAIDFLIAHASKVETVRAREPYYFHASTGTIDWEDSVEGRRLAAVATACRAIDRDPAADVDEDHRRIYAALRGTKPDPIDVYSRLIAAALRGAQVREVDLVLLGIECIIEPAIDALGYAVGKQSPFGGDD